MELTIETSKPFGPVPGTFSSVGAIDDSGTMEILDRKVSGKGAPTFEIAHLTILFTGASGTLTVKAEIVETLGADPLILANEGTWAIIASTGAYDGFHGVGSVTGIADEHVNVIRRTFQGSVQDG